jgi:hypothetical protein
MKNQDFKVALVNKVVSRSYPCRVTVSGLDKQTFLNACWNLLSDSEKGRKLPALLKWRPCLKITGTEQNGGLLLFIFFFLFLYFLITIKIKIFLFLYHFNNFLLLIK